VNRRAYVWHGAPPKVGTVTRRELKAFSCTVSELGPVRVGASSGEYRANGLAMGTKQGRGAHPDVPGLRRRMRGVCGHLTQLMNPWLSLVGAATAQGVCYVRSSLRRAEVAPGWTANYPRMCGRGSTMERGRGITQRCCAHFKSQVRDLGSANLPLFCRF
jgi:hypothetical protein